MSTLQKYACLLLSLTNTSKTMQNKVIVIVALTTIIIHTSCNRYYTPTKLSPSINAIKTGVSERKYFILSDSVSNYAINNIVLDERTNTISADLAQVPSNHTLYLVKTGRLTLPEKKRRGYTFAKSQSAVLDEVHLFSDSIVSSSGTSRIDIPLSSISNMEEIKYNRARTNRQNARVLLTLSAVAFAYWLRLPR
jgi:hypothetical protein